jgi:hypothetical protein
MATYEPRTVPWARIRRWPGLALALFWREMPSWILLVLLNIALALSVVLALHPYASIIGPPLVAVALQVATAWVYFAIARRSDTGTWPSPSTAAIELARFTVGRAAMLMAGAGAIAVAWQVAGSPFPLLGQILTDVRASGEYLDPDGMIYTLRVWIIVAFLNAGALPFRIPVVAFSGLGLFEAITLARIGEMKNRAALSIIKIFWTVLMALQFLFPANWLTIVLLPLGICLIYVAYRDVFEHAEQNQPQRSKAAVDAAAVAS